MKSKTQRMAITLGIFWGVALFLMTIASVYTQYGNAFLTMLQSVYPGYEITIIGAVIGLIYGFLDGFIMVYVISWIYDRVAR